MVTCGDHDIVGAADLDGQPGDFATDSRIGVVGDCCTVERQRLGRRVIGHGRAAHAADDLQVVAVDTGHLCTVDPQVIGRDIAVNIEVRIAVAHLGVGLTAIDRCRRVHAVELFAVKGVVVRAAARVGEHNQKIILIKIKNDPI